MSLFWRNVAQSLLPPIFCPFSACPCLAEIHGLAVSSFSICRPPNCILALSLFLLQTVVKLESAWWAVAEMPEQNRKESIQVGITVRRNQLNLQKFYPEKNLIIPGFCLRPWPAAGLQVALYLLRLSKVQKTYKIE